jgi:hypothetical protein
MRWPSAPTACCWRPAGRTRCSASPCASRWRRPWRCPSRVRSPGRTRSGSSGPRASACWPASRSRACDVRRVRPQPAAPRSACCSCSGQGSGLRGGARGGDLGSRCPSQPTWTRSTWRRPLASCSPLRADRAVKRLSRRGLRGQRARAAPSRGRPRRRGAAARRVAAPAGARAFTQIVAPAALEGSAAD